VDGAGGGTGMSPWRMMNEWGIPPVELHSLLYQYAPGSTTAASTLPALAVAGGFTFEDQIFKGLALGAPFVRLVGMARAPMAAAMVGKTIGRAIDDGQLPVYVERFGRTREEIFVTAAELRHELGEDEYQRCRPAPSASSPTTSAWPRGCARSWPAPASSPCPTSPATTWPR
jgi:glutamate synthase domain-containing protein 2